jgi:hypothetical protein
VAEHDLEQMLEYFTAECLKRLRVQKQKVGREYGLKFNVSLLVTFTKYSQELHEFVQDDSWFHSHAKTAFQRADLNRAAADAFNDILVRFDNFVLAGSGWSVQKVIGAELVCTKFHIVRGGCSRQVLPKILNASHGVISLDPCPDDKCFLYAVTAALANVKRNPTRLSQRVYDKIFNLLPPIFKFPLKVSDIQVFERACQKVSINVYGFDGAIAVPIYISGKNRELHANLLLHNNHYFPVRNLCSLLKINNGVSRRKAQVCQNCLALFTNQARFSLHKKLCRGDGPRLKFPSTPSEATMKFENYQSMICAPFVMYCDLETLVADKQLENHKKLISSRKHIPISVCGLTVCSSAPQFTSDKPFLYTGTDCISMLLGWIEEEVARIQQILRITWEEMYMSHADRRVFEKASACAMCRKKFGSSCEKVRDHDHLSGAFRFALCNSCNLSHASTRYQLNIFFHGLSNYDSHFLVQDFSRFETNRIRIIPKTGEKYLAFMIHSVRFKDSLAFLNSSLATLAANLHSKGEENFACVNRFVRNPAKRKYFFQKGVYPYSYMNCEDKLEERSLPPIEDFKNDLSGEELPLSDYEFAQKVWEAFSCETMQDYMEIYLLCDVLLLADVFENFRQKSLEDYGLDPAHYFSTPHFTMDAFLKQSQTSLELILDINQYLLLIEGIRGGLSCVSKRFAQANDPAIPHLFDPSKPTKHILYLDANNLYGKAMMEPLPVGGFCWMERSELDLARILKIKTSASEGCILDCDLEYPSSLHEHHIDFPLAPHKHSVRRQELSKFAREICAKHNLKGSVGSEKLMATFLPRKNYVLHYRNLQLYVKLGLKVTRIHRAVKFTQRPIISEYIQTNSQRRAESTNNFDSDYYKLLSNSLFGKTIERPEKRCRVVLTDSAAQHEKLVGSPCYKSSKIINEQLVGVTMGYAEVEVKKPFYIGMTILELAKRWMYRFHYLVMKPHFGSHIQLLYTDTDSLLYEITSNSLIPAFQKLSQHFDFSNYPPTHPLFDASRTRLPGLFKDEAAGKTVTEFVGLRAKMYAYTVVDHECGKVQENKAAKGVKASVIKQSLTHNDYKNCLFNSAQYEHEFHQITSKSHSVTTAHKTKISLSPFDDKRFLLNAVDSVPYGHEKHRMALLCEES